MISAAEIPQGNTWEDIRARKQIIKDIYATWIAEHPDKKVWNKTLQANICVKFLSINETVDKAASTYASTCAILKLSDILSNAVLLEELPPKQKTNNQKIFVKIFIMRFDNIKLVVGLQRSTQEYVQYSITRLHSQPTHLG